MYFKRLFRKSLFLLNLNLDIEIGYKIRYSAMKFKHTSEFLNNCKSYSPNKISRILLLAKVLNGFHKT